MVKELQGPTVDGNELREETRYLNVDFSAVTGLLVQVARETDDRVTALEGKHNATSKSGNRHPDQHSGKSGKRTGCTCPAVNRSER